jgi:hypothetical protein
LRDPSGQVGGRDGLRHVQREPAESDFIRSAGSLWTLTAMAGVPFPRSDAGSRTARMKVQPSSSGSASWLRENMGRAVKAVG